MKKKFLAFLFIFSSIYVFSQVGINTTSPSPASVLDIESSSDNINYGGFLPPRVSLVQRNLIPVTASDDGLLVYLIEGTTRCIQIYDGVDAAWEDIYCMPLNAAPVASLLQISGIFQVGEILTASFTYSDAENDPEGTHTYTWYRADDASGTNQTQIQTGNSSTYTILPADLNSYIAFEVTPLATQGTLTGLPVLSSYSGPVLSPSAGGIFISEIADPDNNAGARFIELTNGSANPIDVSNWEVLLFYNTNTTSGGNFTFPFSTTISGGDSFIIAQNSTNFQSAFSFAPDDVGFNINSNGDDNFELRDNNGILIDIYGSVGTDQTGTCAEFEDGRTLRESSIIEGNTTWDESEWIVRADSTIGGCTDHSNTVQNAPADFSPGTHPN